MATNIEEARSLSRVRLPGILLKTGYFLLHYLEMCVVMCTAGIGVMSALLRWVSPQIGYPELRRQFPELSTLVLAIWFTLLMIAWMRFRGHEWRPALEMASTSIVAYPLLIGAAWLGVVAKTSLYPLECGLACAFMLVPMLLRLDHYAGRHVDHSHHAHAAHMSM